MCKTYYPQLITFLFIVSISYIAFLHITIIESLPMYSEIDPQLIWNDVPESIPPCGDTIKCLITWEHNKVYITELTN